MRILTRGVRVPEGVRVAAMTRTVNLDALAIGTDVSEYVGPVNWVLVAAAGYVYGIPRATHGSHVDVRFRENFAGIQEAGLLRSWYAVDRPDVTLQVKLDAIRAALENLDRADFTPWADIEVVRPYKGAPAFTPVQIADSAWAFIQGVRDIWGAWPDVYTAQWVTDGYIRRPDGSYPPSWLEVVRNCKLAVADYTDPINLPGGWNIEDLTHRQVSASATIPGINAEGDVDHFYIEGRRGTVAEFYAWAAQDPPAPAPDPGVRFARVITGRLNVRTGAGTRFPIIGVLNQNAVPAVLAEIAEGGNLWVQIGENLYCAFFYGGRQLMTWS